MPVHLIDKKIINLGNKLFEAFHLFGLFVIGAAILWASWAEVIEIISHGGPKIKDVLLLFIYLELGAMVGTSRESVNKQMRAWEEAGLVRSSRGSVTLLKPGRLEELAEGDG